MNRRGSKGSTWSEAVSLAFGLSGRLMGPGSVTGYFIAMISAEVRLLLAEGGRKLGTSVNGMDAAVLNGIDGGNCPSCRIDK